ncbi:argonaute-like protein [Sistotremastrum suecicum HHB10207 ss-3]|uniref:Argonaute-like protein n=1 Tax=Sistotremastrum suecicum HHB10207 ss-3 TaxID=1314776 RepID=A0A166EIU6_9AGAM|nr:argonaute-like protein [Sistotremastrum suecicum HHB10207 ss-3]
MPPRIAPRGAGGGPRAAQARVADHVTTIGVRRPEPGKAGTPMEVITNHFRVKIPDTIIHHYDVVISPSQDFPIRLNMELVTRLQTVVAKEIFTPRAVYDGRKNLFAARELPFGPGVKSREFEFPLNVRPSDAKDPRGPKLFKITLTKVAEINPEVLIRFLQGKQSHDNMVLTAITALNVIIRMEPTLKYPFNVRSFFTDKETKSIGGGIDLWRGYFQSVRPARDTMLINIDISTGAMFKPGPLLNLCADFLRKGNRPPPTPAQLAPRAGFPDRERLRLQRFLFGVRVTVVTDSAESGPRAPRVIKKISEAGANDLMFELREGRRLSVASYYRETYNKSLKYPDLPCVLVGSGAWIPLEICVVPKGQIMRKQVPSELTKDVLDFATKQPQERLNSIRNGLSVLAYEKSEYVKHFGMKLESEDPMKIKSRVLAPPTLKYGPGSRQPTIMPRDGSWNMVDKKFYQPAKVEGWIIVIYENQGRFGDQKVRGLIDGLVRGCEEVGISGMDRNPMVRWENGQGNVIEQLKAAGLAMKTAQNRFPGLIVAILPDGGNDIYTKIKHFGDVMTGVTTQCLKSAKAAGARPQYFANVCLKLNVKLGGINTIPDARSVPFLSDVNNPTVVIGADVIHPAPGSQGRPSFTSVVASVDSSTSKYIATTRVQTSRQEIIEDLQEMCKYVIDMSCKYRKNVEKKSIIFPKRIIFYRDGVSEGQFRTVLDEEIPKIKAACRELGMKDLPKITVVVVGKRHHVRFFPMAPSQGDKSGNCRAGTVVDTDVSHPTEFDFYLLSHGGLLGTSRPAHYSVLYDENGFSSDGMQQLSFALCHVYARATRSVSIPAPVYYADIVCSRAKNHYAPGQHGFEFDDSGTAAMSDPAQQQKTLQEFKSRFMPLHTSTALKMYFS